MKKINDGIKNLIYTLIYYLSKIVPRKKNRWIFGSWFGNNFSDNSKWLYLYVVDNLKNIDAIWVTKDKDALEQINSLGGRAYLYNSFSANYYALTSRVAIFTQVYYDICPLNLFGGALKVELWHGVALKKIGSDMCRDNRIDNAAFRLYRRITRAVYSFDLYIAPSLEYKSKVISAFDTTKDKVMEVGQPRNDMLCNRGCWETCIRKFRSEIRNRFGVRIEDKKVITYMPTFRDNRDRTFSFLGLDEERSARLSAVLKRYNAVVIEKCHFVDSVWRNSKGGKTDNVIGISEIDTQELLLNTDVLITDYSSCYFDFLLLDRPIIHFAYDYKYYRDEDRGMYYSLEDAAGGAVCYEFDGMLGALERYLEDKDIDGERRRRIRDRFVTFENGKSCEEITGYISEKTGIK